MKPTVWRRDNTATLATSIGIRVRIAPNTQGKLKVDLYAPKQSCSAQTGNPGTGGRGVSSVIACSARALHSG